MRSKQLLTLLSVFICVAISNAQSPIRFYENAKVGYKDASGNVIVPAKYAAGSDFSEGYALVIEKNKRGYIDATGKAVSYTHLDVYKRQRYIRNAGSAFNK